jgi:hypothetical protein
MLMCPSYGKKYIFAMAMSSSRFSTFNHLENTSGETSVVKVSVISSRTDFSFRTTSSSVILSSTGLSIADSGGGVSTRLVWDT